ncbi:MAG: hypothetical protein IIT33_00415, partial [Prevotella sp.]|nr:hypothetical protein [Prevotella sp.]
LIEQQKSQFVAIFALFHSLMPSNHPKIATYCDFRIFVNHWISYASIIATTVTVTVVAIIMLAQRFHNSKKNSHFQKNLENG